MKSENSEFVKYLVSPHEIHIRLSGWFFRDLFVQGRAGAGTEMQAALIRRRFCVWETDGADTRSGYWWKAPRRVRPAPEQVPLLVFWPSEQAQWI